MKNYYLVALFTISLGISNAQTKEKDTISSKVKSDIYVGIGILAQNGFNINQKLLNSNLATILNAMPEFVVGLNIFGQKFSGGIEVGTNYSDKQVGNNFTKFISTNLRGNFSYNLINKPKIAFTTGLNVTLNYSEINIFDGNAVINLNNLNPISNGSNTLLYSEVLYVGPAVSLYLFKHTNWQIRLNATYEIGLTKGSWKSEFVNVSNTVNERGASRFIFGIVLL